MRYGRELPGYPFNAKAFLTRCLIVAQRKVWGHWLARSSGFGKPPIDWNEDETNQHIAEIIRAGRPAMIARFGSNELEATLRGMAVADRRNGTGGRFRDLLLGRCAPYWWDNSIRGSLGWIAGFFPCDDASMDAFSARVVRDCSGIDVLASWLEGEGWMKRRFFPKASLCSLGSFSHPFCNGKPWYRALEGKRVLVVHPFADTIRSQYARRDRLFPQDRILPLFHLETYRPVVSLAGKWNESAFPSWFDALERMIREISDLSFDVAIIGAGAYGMSLAAAVKQMGRIGIHMGGATQLLFGIKGGRWDDTDFGRRLYNDSWVRPSASEVPDNARTVEGGCYW